MKKVSYTHSRSGIFLMEIIIAILFFSIVSAICLNIFVHTHNLSKSTAELNFAVREAANAAEITKSADTFEDAAQRLEETGGYTRANNNTDCNVLDALGYADLNDENVYIAFWDDEYQMCTQADAAYCILAAASNDNDDLTAAFAGVVTWEIRVVSLANVASNSESYDTSAAMHDEVSNSSANKASSADTRASVIYELTSEVYYAE